MITLEDVLDTLVSRGGYAPSSMGSQLERLASGITTSPDPFRARDEAENTIMRNAQVLRVISDFTGRREFRERFETLKKLQRATHPQLDQGYIAFGTLRAYHERCTRSKERALVEVYHFLGTIAPDAVPGPPKQARDVDDLVQLFREGKAKRARALAAEAYADAYLALESHLRQVNRKTDRATRAS